MSATNRNPYLNVICIKLIKTLKNKILTFYLRFLGLKNLKFGLFEIFRFLKIKNPLQQPWLLYVCRLNKLRVRSGDSECSADGPGTPHSPYPLSARSVSVVERAQSNTDNQGDDHAAAGPQIKRQMSVSSVVLTEICRRLYTAADKCIYC